MGCDLAVMRKGAKKKLLFFTCEPGGAEVIIPVIELMQSTGNYEVVTLGYGLGLEHFRKKNVACREISPIELNDFPCSRLFNSIG